MRIPMTITSVKNWCILTGRLFSMKDPCRVWMVLEYFNQSNIPAYEIHISRQNDEGYFAKGYVSQLRLNISEFDSKVVELCVNKRQEYVYIKCE